MNAKPCPFCGHVGVTVIEGSTFRWRIAECVYCGAQCGEVRVQTTGEGTPEEWEAKAHEKAIAEWNTRDGVVPLPLKDHEIRELVNGLTGLARNFHNHDSLRDRMSEVVHTLLKQIAAGASDPMHVADDVHTKGGEAEPVAWMHAQGNHYEPSLRRLDDDEKARGWTEYPLHAYGVSGSDGKTKP